MAAMTKKKELIFSGTVTVLTAALLIRAFMYPGESSQFPRFLMVLQLVFSALLLARAIRLPAAAGGSGAAGAGDARAAPKSGKDAVKSLVVPFQVFVSASLYLIMIGFLGYFTATAIFLCGTMFWFGTRKPLIIVSVTAGFMLVIYALFVLFIGVRLPTGILI